MAFPKGSRMKQMEEERQRRVAETVPLVREAIASGKKFKTSVLMELYKISRPTAIDYLNAASRVIAQQDAMGTTPPWEPLPEDERPSVPEPPPTPLREALNNAWKNKGQKDGDEVPPPPEPPRIKHVRKQPDPPAPGTKKPAKLDKHSSDKVEREEAARLAERDFQRETEDAFNLLGRAMRQAIASGEATIELAPARPPLPLATHQGIDMMGLLERDSLALQRQAFDMDIDARICRLVLFGTVKGLPHLCTECGQAENLLMQEFVPTISAVRDHFEKLSLGDLVKYTKGAAEVRTRHVDLIDKHNKIQETMYGPEKVRTFMEAVNQVIGELFPASKKEFLQRVGELMAQHR